MKTLSLALLLTPATAFAGLLSDTLDSLGDTVGDVGGAVGGVVSGGGTTAAAAPEINGSAAILAVTLVAGIASLIKRSRGPRHLPH